jgi:ElaB/YqjD/DUF883 family membrane-anchored ribosome-binding protein
MAEKLDDKKIGEALELLNEVAKEKKADLQNMISEKYSNLQSALGGAAARIEHAARETYARGKEMVTDIASKADDSVHENPWKYIGATAVGFLILGIFLGRSRK